MSQINANVMFRGTSCIYNLRLIDIKVCHSDTKDGCKLLRKKRGEFSQFNF